MGELWVRGPNVMRGYYRGRSPPPPTPSPPTGRLKSSDLVPPHADGALFIVGRAKELHHPVGAQCLPRGQALLDARIPPSSQSVVVEQLARPTGNEDVVAFVEKA